MLQACKSKVAASKRTEPIFDKFCSNSRKKQGKVVKPQNKRDDPKYSCPSMQDCSESVSSKSNGPLPVIGITPLAQKQLDTGKIPPRSLYQAQKTQAAQTVVHEQHVDNSVPSNKERETTQKFSTKHFQEMDERITESQENFCFQVSSSSKADAKNLQPELPEEASREVEQLKHDIVEEECGSLGIPNPCTKTETYPVFTKFPNELQAMCLSRLCYPKTSLDLRMSNNMAASEYIQCNKASILDTIEPEPLPVPSTFKTMALHQPMHILSGYTAVLNSKSGLGAMSKFSTLGPAPPCAKKEEFHFARNSLDLEFEPSAWNLAPKFPSLLERFSICTIQRKAILGNLLHIVFSLLLFFAL